MNGPATLPLNEIHILETCSLIEERCAHIYRHFRRLFSDDAALAAFWHRIAVDEDHHADRFRLAARRLEGGLPDVDFVDRRVTAMLARLESIHGVLETNHQPSPVEAFEIALYMEKDLAEYHIGSIVTYAGYGLSELFIAMEKEDQAHLEMLQQAVGRFCP